ncbi:MAG: hypothetical protein ABH863_05270 [Candidatus Micrarchaeota archaeon]
MDLDEIASGRCKKLLALAAEIYDEDKALSKRYVSLGRKVAMRHRIPLGSKTFCKSCNTVFIAGKTLKVRVASSKKGVLYECKACGSSRLFPYVKEKRSKKRRLPK